MNPSRGIFALVLILLSNTIRALADELLIEVTPAHFDLSEMSSSGSTAYELASQIASGTSQGYCHLLWPKMGGFYGLGQLVYVFFHCEVPEEVSSALQASKYALSITYSGSCYMDDERVFGSEMTGTVFLAEMASISDFNSDFVISSSCGTMKYEFAIMANDFIIDVVDVVIFTTFDEYFESNYKSSRKCVFNATSQSCDGGGEGTLSPRYYDFVEIGTSGYDTLIEAASDWHVGLSVEAMKELQDTLPDRAGVTKVNAAIGDEAGWRDLYILPGSVADVVGFNFSHLHFNRAVFSLDSIYPIFFMQPLRPPYLELYSIRRKVVRTVSVRQLLAEQAVGSIALLKIDANEIQSLRPFFALWDGAGQPAIVKPPRYIEYRVATAQHRPVALEQVPQLLSMGYRVYSGEIGMESDSNETAQFPDFIFFAELVANSSLYWGEREPYVADRIATLLHPAMTAFRSVCFTAQSYENNTKSSLDSWKSGGRYCHFILKPSAAHMLFSPRPAGTPMSDVNTHKNGPGKRVVDIKSEDIVSIIVN